MYTQGRSVACTSGVCVRKRSRPCTRTPDSRGQRGRRVAPGSTPPLPNRPFLKFSTRAIAEERSVDRCGQRGSIVDAQKRYGLSRVALWGTKLRASQQNKKKSLKPSPSRPCLQTGLYFYRPGVTRSLKPSPSRPCLQTAVMENIILPILRLKPSPSRPCLQTPSPRKPQSIQYAAMGSARISGHRKVILFATKDR